MNGRYRRFDRPGLPSVRMPKVTIQTGGIISFNWFAYEALHRPRLVRPSFDEQTRISKIEAARVEDAFTIPVRQEGRGTTHVFAGRTFTQHFGIDTSTARQYDATVEQGKLYVDLKREPKLVSKRKKTSAVAPPPAATSAAQQDEQEEHQAERASETPAQQASPPQVAAPGAPSLEDLMQAFLYLVEQYKAQQEGKGHQPSSE